MAAVSAATEASRSRSGSRDLPLLSRDGANLPAWVFTALVAGVFGVGGFQTATHLRLQSAESDISKIEEEVKAVPVVLHRVDDLEKHAEARDRSYEELRGRIDAMTNVLIRICTKLDAGCE